MQQSQLKKEKEDLGLLPQWDLSEFYKSINDPSINQDLDQIQDRAKNFQQSYQSKLSSLSGADLGKAVAIYEKFYEDLDLIICFAQLHHAIGMDDPKIGQFYQSVQEKYTEIVGHLLFFTLELNKIDDATLSTQKKDPALSKYTPFLRDIRIFKPHQLSDELEQYALDKSITSHNAWIRLFNETMAGLRFPYQGKDLTSAEIFSYLSDNNRQHREEAAHSVANTLSKNSKLLAHIYNTLCKDKDIEDKKRSYAHPMSSRNLSNYVDDQVVNTLIESVKDYYPKLSHRYFKIKAKWLGLPKLSYWDRNAPLQENADNTYSWDEARDIVLKAYESFSPKLAHIAKEFFDKNWIDAKVRSGKDAGAFSHPMVPKAHPFILMNFQGKTRDIMTLAHELGHGIHQVLASNQGPLLSQTTLTLAETASVFGEMLTFQSLLDNTKDKEAKKLLLASKIEDMLNTVVRQIAFCDFEKTVHEKRKTSELTVEDLGKIWMEKQHESLGDSFDFDPEYHVFWSYIPHFIHTPFYVYAYAFGDCLVNSLYDTYLNKPDGFVEKYMELLSSGGIHHHKEALAPFGLDANDKNFWKKGLSVIERYIDQLEEIS
ncbi:MAG: M3 family oligoendopeptidase [Alphaproteobacteria bacterium]|nr:M3 family oligoendopeptidase [Alphaproteobacteria bacterium]